MSYQTEAAAKARLRALVEKAAADLGEHFAAVQIHVSWPVENGNTDAIHHGCGDWYARQGLAHEFIEKDKAEEVGMSVARHMPEAGD